jgi:hypothetical protein
MRRLLLASVVSMGLIIPASAIAVGVSSPAWASSGVSCGKVKGTVTGSFVVSKCLPTSKILKKADKTASAPTSSLTNETGGTLTWSNSGQKTTVQITNTTLPGHRPPNWRPRFAQAVYQEGQDQSREGHENVALTRRDLPWRRPTQDIDRRRGPIPSGWGPASVFEQGIRRFRQHPKRISDSFVGHQRRSMAHALCNLMKQLSLVAIG